VVKVTLAGPGKPYDLILICIIAATAVLLSIFSSPSVLLAILSFICVFFAPGYALISALFPAAIANSPEDIKGGKLLDSEISLLERIAAAIVLSLVMFAIGGISLSWTPSGLAKPVVLMEVMGLTIGLSALAIYRRASLPHDREFVLGFEIGLKGAKYSRAEKVLVMGVGVALLFAGLYAVGAIPGAIGPEPYTELYITGSDGSLGSLPQAVTHGNDATVRVGIDNHMLQGVSYNLTIGVKSNGTFLNGTALDWSSPLTFVPGDSYYQEFTVLDGGSMARNLIFNFAQPGKYQIFFVLNYLEDQQSLWLWVTVT
jgi:uncharacterized membrane protein